LINVAGRKLSPATVEQALSRHPAVRDCLVFGVASQAADRGEHIVACVQVSRDTTVTELRQFLLAQLPAWQVPREWQFVASLSANQRGKISRAEWRRRYLAR
jgi:acyl-coenzyme A synthetase/AMP-(fatty) acid ligase